MTMARRIKNSKAFKTAWDYLFILLGTFFYTASVYVFTAPNNIAPGGVTGLATALHYLFPALKIGTTVTLINIPLLVAGYRFLGKRFIFKTLVSTVLFSVLHDYVFELFMPAYTGDKLLASLFGGVLSGLGLALVFIKGGSTGGTDITNRIIQKKLPYISLGKIVLASDAVVILFASAVFGEIESAMYAAVAMFMASKVMDGVLYGADIGKMVMIVTSKPERMCEEVNTKINRGTTVISAKGGYTGQDKYVIMCAVKTNQFYKLKRLIYSVDDNAFMMVTNSTEVVGKGFKNIYDDI